MVCLYCVKWCRFLTFGGPGGAEYSLHTINYLSTVLAVSHSLWHRRADNTVVEYFSLAINCFHSDINIMIRWLWSIPCVLLTTFSSNIIIVILYCCEVSLVNYHQLVVSSISSSWSDWAHSHHCATQHLLMNQLSISLSTLLIMIF